MRARLDAIMTAALLALLVAVLGCKASDGEACDTTADCESALSCHSNQCRDPARYCKEAPEHQAACARDGLCTLADGRCLAMKDEDCGGSRRCKEHGQCTAGQGCCSKDGTCLPDADDPVTELLRLADAAERSAALDKLRAHLDSRLDQDRGDAHGGRTAPFCAATVKALVALAADAGVDPASRGKTLRLLADCRHPDATRTLVAALDAYQAHTGEPGPVEAAMARVVAGLAGGGTDEVATRLFALFTSLQASSRRAELEGFGHAVGRAMVALARESWEPKLIELVERPPPGDGDTKTSRNETYWKSHAARALGRLRSSKAVPGLLRVALSPLEEDAAPSALEALALIGKPAADAAAMALRGEDAAISRRLADDLARNSDEDVDNDVARKADHVRIEGAAVVLANIGRKDAVQLVLGALDDSDVLGKARISFELWKLPHTHLVLDAFKKQVTTLPLDVPVSKRHEGIEALVEVSGRFFDRGLPGWLSKGAAELTGTDMALAPYREAALLSALALASREQLPAVDPLAALITPSKWASERNEGDKLLDACKTELACHLAAAIKPREGASSMPRGSKETGPEGSGPSFTQLKAATMAGVVAKPADRPAIVDALWRASHADVRAVLAAALEHLSPDGDAALAAKLMSGAARLGVDDASLIGTAARLRARAE